MEVKKHIILFLDILGYKNLIESCQDVKMENKYLEKIYALMAELSNYVEKHNKIVDALGNDLKLSRFKYLIFSDNILFFAPYENEVDMTNLYMNLLYGLSEFLVQYTREDIFLRGAITKGNLYYDDGLHFIYGSGLVRAYQLESEVAVYPRVIIDECLNPSPILIGLAQDDEKIWYFDYLNLGYSIMSKGGEEGIKKFLLCLEDRQNAICYALQKYRFDNKIFLKYQWLATYYNKFCEKNGFNNLL